MKKLLITIAIAVPLALSLSAVAPAGVATAAPITCSGNQTPTKVAGGWDCINNGDNPTGSERTKNPNDRK